MQAGSGACPVVQFCSAANPYPLPTVRDCLLSGTVRVLARQRLFRRVKQRSPTRFVSDCSRRSRHMRNACGERPSAVTSSACAMAPARTMHNKIEAAIAAEICSQSPRPLMSVRQSFAQGTWAARIGDSLCVRGRRAICVPVCSGRVGSMQ